MDADTFAVVLEGLDEVADALAIAERILATLPSSIAFRGDQLFFTVTIGIAVSATGYRSAEDMVRDCRHCRPSRPFVGVTV